MFLWRTFLKFYRNARTACGALFYLLSEWVIGMESHPNRARRFHSPIKFSEGYIQSAQLCKSPIVNERSTLAVAALLIRHWIATPSLEYFLQCTRAGFPIGQALENAMHAHVLFSNRQTNLSVISLSLQSLSKLITASGCRVCVWENKRRSLPIRVQFHSPRRRRNPPASAEISLWSRASFFFFI